MWFAIGARNTKIAIIVNKLTGFQKLIRELSKARKSSSPIIYQSTEIDFYKMQFSERFWSKNARAEMKQSKHD